MMSRRTVTYRLFGAPPGSQARAESFQPRPRSPRLNRFKVERWASVVSDSEHCSPQLPWQLGKIRKPGGRETALSLGRQFTCSKWGPCLATYRSDPKRPRVGCRLSRNWGEGWLGGGWAASHETVGSGPRRGCACRRGRNTHSPILSSPPGVLVGLRVEHGR